MVKNWCTIILLLIGILFLPGCWSKKEIEKLAIVSAFGIDQVVIDGREKWQVTLEIFHPRALTPVGVGGGGGGGQEATAWIVTSIGDTLQEAANNFSTRTPRTLFFSHSNFIVIGEETARQQNLEDILALFFSAKEVRLRNWVLVSDGKASDMLAAGWELEQDISTELFGLIEETRQQLSRAEVSDLREVGDALASFGKDVIAGRIEIFPTPEPPTGGQDKGLGKKPQSVRLAGASVFSQGKLAGWFSDRETRGYLFITGKAKSTVVPLKLQGRERFDATVKIYKGTSKIKYQVQDGQARVKVESTAEGHLEELFPGDFKVTSQLLDQVGEKVALELQGEALDAIKKAQEYRADVFGFGEGIYRHHPHYWREIRDNWRDYFASLPVEVEVKVYIRRTEMFSQPIPAR